MGNQSIRKCDDHVYYIFVSLEQNSEPKCGENNVYLLFVYVILS